MKGEGMRGLAVFISDIRNCKSKEQERKRINKELANIRSKFKGDKQLDGYQKKKYVCKLLFIFLLGNDIDFGHMEAVNLLSSSKYSEKQIGYLFISVLVSASSDLIKLIVQGIKNDLATRNPVFVNLALTCIANIASQEMVEALGQDIPRLLVAADVTDSVKQNAALCMLKLLRVSPTVIPHGEWSSRIVQLLNDKHLGVVTATCSLIQALAERHPEEYTGCVALAVNRLSRIVTSPFADLQDYTYYFVPAPWLTVKLLRLLQCYPPPSEDITAKGRLIEALEAILNRSQEPPKTKKVQHSNAKNAVLFEAINLIIQMDSEPNLQVRACNQLGQFLSNRETNLRYLAMEGMCKLARSEFSSDAVRKHQETVLLALKTERDVSVRQRAVDLLYAMCDRSNAETIVQEMLAYLESADYAIREELVLKVAILAEKFAVDYSWYVDTILNLIRLAGDFVSEEVWYRVVQIIINRDDIQGYAAKTVFEALQAPACHENMVKVGGYVLGEFGNLIAGDARSSPMVQFQLLHSKYPFCSQATKGLLLSTYMKFINLFPEISPAIREMLQHDTQLRNSDPELQQRSLEYLKLSTVANRDVLATVLEEMPPFPERESTILAKLKKKKGAAAVVEKELPDVQAKETTAPGARNGPVTIAQLAAGGEQRGAEGSLISVTAPAQPAAPVVPVSDGILVDTFATQQQLAAPVAAPVAPSASLPVNGPLTGPSVEESLKRFLFRNNGILFENELVQVGVKSEFRNNLGRLGFFIGNKSPGQLVNVKSDIHLPGSLGSQLRVQVKPIESTIEAGAQIQQLVNVECLEEFNDYPLIDIQFVYAGTPQHVTLKLPLFLSKFFSPTDLSSQDFFSRWKALGGAQERQKIFSAKFPIEDIESSKTKLNGFGPKVLEDIDPNPENFVCAGIVHTTSGQIGCLIRLEPNKQAKMYRLTVRASKETVSGVLCDLLADQF